MQLVAFIKNDGLESLDYKNLSPKTMCVKNINQYVCVIFWSVFFQKKNSSHAICNLPDYFCFRTLEQNLKI